MDKASATLATFADFRIVKTRKLAQFVFELPIEKADEALAALGGLPRSDGERWCGIALVTSGPEAVVNPPRSTPPDAERQVQDTPRHKHNSRTFQAVMACKTEQFREWVRAGTNLKDPVDEDTVAEWVRVACNITSRSQLDTNVDRGKAWDAIFMQYQKDMGLMAEEFPPR